MKRSSKTKTIGFLIRLSIALVIIAGIVLGGYFVIDKAVVPSYFGKYGIKNLNDLVQMVKVMRNAPDEKVFITHPYTASHELSAIAKLEDAGVPIENGKINFNKISDGEYEITEEAKQGVYVSDYEMAAILGQMLESGYLVTYLKDLKYFDTMSFEAREIIMSPISSTKVVDGSQSFANEAKISLTIKLNTKNAQKHMAKEMDVPLFLLDLIMPENMYLTCTYDVKISEDGKYQVNNSTLGINGRTPEQSEILLNMLISFIFPAEDEMSPEKLSDTFGEVVNSGLKILGDVVFYTKTTSLGEENGIYVKMNSNLDYSEPEVVE